MAGGGGEIRETAIRRALMQRERTPTAPWNRGVWIRFVLAITPTVVLAILGYLQTPLITVRIATPDQYERVGTLTVARTRCFSVEHLWGGYDEQILDTEAAARARRCSRRHRRRPRRRFGDLRRRLARSEWSECDPARRGPVPPPGRRPGRRGGSRARTACALVPHVHRRRRPTGQPIVIHTTPWMDDRATDLRARSASCADRIATCRTKRWEHRSGRVYCRGLDRSGVPRLRLEPARPITASARPRARCPARRTRAGPRSRRRCARRPCAS